MDLDLIKVVYKAQKASGGTATPAPLGYPRQVSEPHILIVNVLMMRLAWN